MHSRRTLVGTVVSALWLVVAAVLLLSQPSQAAKMAPNEWGDFLAGIFAPLAFLWLVLGYMQQGDELRLSTEALRLQADELRNSVEQQRALVEVSRLQVESEREALAFERHLREDLSLPRFAVLGGGGMFSGNGRSSYNFTLSNSGHAATELLIKATLYDGSVITFLNAPLFDKGAQRQFTLDRDEPIAPAGSVLSLEYKDGLGRFQSNKFAFGRKEDDPRGMLLFGHPEA